MTEKIPQHRHCRGCGRAFIGKDPHCSDECKSTSTAAVKKKKQQLQLLYVFTFIVLILMLIYVWSGG